MARIATGPPIPTACWTAGRAGGATWPGWATISTFVSLVSSMLVATLFPPPNEQLFIESFVVVGAVVVVVVVVVVDSSEGLNIEAIRLKIFGDGDEPDVDSGVLTVVVVGEGLGL